MMKEREPSILRSALAVFGLMAALAVLAAAAGCSGSTAISVGKVDASGSGVAGAGGAFGAGGTPGPSSPADGGRAGAGGSGETQDAAASVDRRTVADGAKESPATDAGYGVTNFLIPCRTTDNPCPAELQGQICGSGGTYTLCTCQADGKQSCFSDWSDDADRCPLDIRTGASCGAPIKDATGICFLLDHAAHQQLACFCNLRSIWECAIVPE